MTLPPPQLGRAVFRPLLSLLLVCLLGLAGMDGAQAAPVPDAALARVDKAISTWELQRAKQALAELPPGPHRQLRAGIIAIYEGEYTRAEQLLAGALASRALAGDKRELARAEQYLSLARGSLRALGSGVTVESPDGLVEARFADDEDALLAPYLFDAMKTARERLGEDLGVIPDHTVRFEFLDDPAKLAMVTPLKLENVRTTGTVGVTKYRRIVLITPRVMIYGYGWIDTAVHEYVHYLLTIRTGNNAPVWLQEGLAKLLEARWRASDPPPLDEAIANLLHRALTRDELVTFQEMYPSVAMLPSQEQAALAYAEVETMLGLLRERKGPEAIERLLQAVAAGDDAEQALASAWGASFEDFMGEWKGVMLRRTAGTEAGELPRPKFETPGEQEQDEDPDLLGDVFSHLGGGRARQHARLGQLLQLRDHVKAAVKQYEKARRADRRARRDPQLSRRLGELYVKLERYTEAVPLLEVAGQNKPNNANIAAAEARARLRSGDLEGARRAASRAVRTNPFIPSLHCDLAELAETETRRTEEQSLCRP